MLLLGIDFETTGLYPPDCHIIDIGISLYDPELGIEIESYSTLIKNVGVTVSPVITAITGIADEAVYAHGKRPEIAFKAIENMAGKASAWVAHNGDFEREFMKVHMPESRLLELPLLDTMKDIPYPDSIRHRDLERLGLSHKCPNLMAHRALPDVQAMLEVLKCYDWETVKAYWHEPSLTYWADCDIENKDQAKGLGFGWNPNIRKWTKSLRKSEHLALCKTVDDEQLDLKIILL